MDDVAFVVVVNPIGGGLIVVCSSSFTTVTFVVGANELVEAGPLVVSTGSPESLSTAVVISVILAVVLVLGAKVDVVPIRRKISCTASKLDGEINTAKNKYLNLHASNSSESRLARWLQEHKVNISIISNYVTHLL